MEPNPQWLCLECSSIIDYAVDAFQGIERKLRQLCRNLDDIERDILLEAAFAMATADAHMAVTAVINFCDAVSCNC
jgi:hypothetical protein